MSPYAIIDVVLLAILLLSAEIRYIIIRFHPDRVTVRPSPFIRILTLSTLLLPIALLLGTDFSSPAIELFYGLVTVPMTALLLYVTGREGFAIKDFSDIVYTPPFFGKRVTISLMDLRGYADGPNGELLLVLGEPLPESGETVIGTEDGVGFAAIEKIYSVLMGYAVDEIPYAEARELKAKARLALLSSENGKRHRRRETAIHLRAIGLVAVHLSLASAVSLWVNDLSKEAFPIGSIIFSVIGLLLFLTSFFFAERHEK